MRRPAAHSTRPWPGQQPLLTCSLTLSVPGSRDDLWCDAGCRPCSQGGGGGGGTAGGALGGGGGSMMTGCAIHGSGGPGGHGGTAAAGGALDDACGGMCAGQGAGCSGSGRIQSAMGSGCWDCSPRRSGSVGGGAAVAPAGCTHSGAPAGWQRAPAGPQQQGQGRRRRRRRCTRPALSLGRYLSPSRQSDSTCGADPAESRNWRSSGHASRARPFVFRLLQNL